jgi:hypothetical protein
MSLITREQLKAWLTSIPDGRKWLAEKCNVSKPTVDGWCSNRAMPRHAQMIIHELMSTTPKEGRVIVSLSPDEFALVETARHLGKFATLDTFAHHAVMEKAMQITEKKKHAPGNVVKIPTQEPIARAAEDQTPYGTGGGNDDSAPASPALKRKHG